MCPTPSPSLSLALAATLAAPVTAQVDEPAFPVFAEEVSVQWISVPIVLAATWPPNLEVERDLFDLRVDGELVRIEAFDEGAAQFGVLFAQDLSGSMEVGSKLELGRIVLEVLGAIAEDEDELAVATFAGGKVYLQIPFTTDEAILRTGPPSWRGYGTTAIRDALATLPAVARRTDRPRRAIVLVTDGVDNASSIPVDEVRALLAGEGLPLYLLDVDHESDQRDPLEDGVDEGFSLGELALASGGRHLMVRTVQQAQSAARLVADDLRRQLLLSFTTDTAGEPGLRSIEVSLRGETAGLSHRSRYFGPPPGHILPSTRKEKP